MKLIRNLTLAVLLASGIAMSASTARAQEPGAEKAIAGKVTSLDKTAQTVNISGQTFQVLPTTKITNLGKQGSFDEIKANQQVSGQYKLSAESKLELTSLDITGATGNAASGATADSGTIFRGKVTKVDAAAQTVMIGTQTYHVLPTTQITTNNAPASFSDVKIGSLSHGQYKTSAENKMELTSLEIGAPGAVPGASGGTADTGVSVRGRATKVDATAQTVTIGTQTYYVLPTTQITKSAAPTSFSEIKVGTPLSGQYKQSAKNKMELTILEIVTPVAVPGAIGGTGTDTTTQTGNTFSGRITTVDPLTQTVTIGSRTYQVLPATTLTMGAGRPATLANLKANQQVTGSYKQADNGKFELLSLQVSNQ